MKIIPFLSVSNAAFSAWREVIESHIRKPLIDQIKNECMTLSYRILLRKEPEGGYTVIAPSLPGCVTYGDTIEEAIIMAKEAIELYIESLRAHNEEIPTEEEILEYT